MMTAGAASSIVFDLPGGIRVSASDDPDSDILQRFFAGYDRAFVLPDEREELDGFEACLALNATHRHVFGRTHSELVAVFEDDCGALLGGANFLSTAVGGGLSTIALNYVYVEAAARGRGLLRKVLGAVRRLALASLQLDPDSPAPVIFIEQNDPLRMTAEQYAADTAHSGLDQVDRLAIWHRVGARIVDFPYIQPALSDDQHADDGLVYAAVDFPGACIDARLLHDHLQSFFAISVRKGQPLKAGDVASRQLDMLLRRTDPVPLLDMGGALERLRQVPQNGACEDFRKLARG
ncbi:MAG: hypothetical protein QM681_03800 [Novosphingobium sp.]